MSGNLLPFRDMYRLQASLHTEFQQRLLSSAYRADPATNMPRLAAFLLWLLTCPTGQAGLVVYYTISLDSPPLPLHPYPVQTPGSMPCRNTDTKCELPCSDQVPIYCPAIPHLYLSPEAGERDLHAMNIGLVQDHTPLHASLQRKQTPTAPPPYNTQCFIHLPSSFVALNHTQGLSGSVLRE